MSILLAIQGAISQGVLWAIMALGVYITFKILDYADMTVDGSFALGGAVSATLIIGYGINPFLSLIVATLAGMIAGTITGLLHTKLHIPPILSGILLMLALYSINIRIMGQPNISLLNKDTIFNQVMKLTGLSNTWTVLLIGVVFLALVVGILYWFFGTELGCALRATGSNEYMVRALGENTDKMKIMGLFIANGLVALSGALVAQSQGFADVQMGTGTIVIGLASIIIGEVLVGKRISFMAKLLSVIVGSIVYRIIIAVVLQLGLESSDLKLISAIIVTIALAVPVIKKKKVKAA